MNCFTLQGNALKNIFSTTWFPKSLLVKSIQLKNKSVTLKRESAYLFLIRYCEMLNHQKRLNYITYSGKKNVLIHSKKIFSIKGHNEKSWYFKSPMFSTKKQS